MSKRKKEKPGETGSEPAAPDPLGQFGPLNPPNRSDPSDQSDSFADSPFDEVVEIPIEDAIDLHLFSPRDVKAVVLEYLEQASERGFEEVRIIHGRGIGERRRQVHDLLRNHPLVADFREAPAPRGGWGATVVWLKTVDRGRTPE